MKKTPYKFQIGDTVKYDGGDYVENKCNCCGHIDESWEEKIIESKVVNRKRRDPNDFYSISDFQTTEEVTINPDGSKTINPYLSTLHTERPMYNEYELENGERLLEENIIIL